MKKSNRGAALLLVVVVIGLLAFLTAEFQRRSHVEAVLAKNNLQALQAQTLLRSGFAVAVAALKADEASLDSREDSWALLPPVPMDGYDVSITITDQYGKFPLGALLYPGGKMNPAAVLTFVKLMQELKSELKAPEEANVDDLVDALVDWIDEDSSNDRFEFNDRFTVPNKPIADLKELRRIEGFDKISEEFMRKILENVDSRNEAGINVNTATVPLLMAVYGLPFDQANELYEEVSTSPANNFAALGRWVTTQSPQFPARFNSERFGVDINIDVQGVVRRAECIVGRKRQGGQLSMTPQNWYQY